MVITFGQIEMDRVVRYGCVVGKSRAEGRARGNVTNAVRSTSPLSCGECGNEHTQIGWVFKLPSRDIILRMISTNVRQRAKVSIPKSPKTTPYFTSYSPEFQNFNAAFEK